MEKIVEIIRRMRADRGVETPFEITSQTSLRGDLGFDSYDLAEFTVRVEDEFGVDVFETGLVERIGDVLAKLKSE